MSLYTQISEIPFSVQQVFDWHCREGALERMTPPWEQVRLVEKIGSIDQIGSKVHLKMKLGFLSLDWIAEHTGYEYPTFFEDKSIRSPFRKFEHQHLFTSISAQQSMLEDRVTYELPFHPWSSWLAGSFVKKKLERMFSFRHQTLKKDLDVAERYASYQSKKILVVGASGLVGEALVPFLSLCGHDVTTMGRGSSSFWHQHLVWDPTKKQIPLDALEGMDAIVNLSGASISGKRWTPEVQQNILQSRLQTTQLLVESLQKLKKVPSVFWNASAIGYYGDTHEPVDENSAKGKGFLSEVCQRWEESALDLVGTSSIRVVCGRIGVVLSPQGGALREMLPPFQWGVGGRVGTGKQGFSWIDIQDLCDSILHCLATPEIQGCINLVSPQALPQEQFASVLGQVLGRPSFFPLPEKAVQLLFGEMGQELLLQGSFVSPRKLQETGFSFRRRHLADSLRFLLGK